jgi:tetratricopeptide (TPR) repeat protein
MQQALLGFKAGSSQAIDARVFLDFDDLNSKPLGLPAAEQKINATLSSNPAYVPALLAQATLNRQRGRQKTAMDLYENILRTFPNFAPATRELALLTAADPDNQEKAYKLASKAREALPDDMELARVLGILSYQKRDYPYARTLFEQVSASNPNDPEVFFRLGLAHLQLKDKARGKQALERALALNLRGDFEKQAKQELARLQ